jgi:predicted O-linked N-acetylglucosamine transferase (SPINDLY family)
MLIDGIDWTLFARTAMEHGLAALAGRTLNCVAPDLVPDEIRDAFRVNVNQTRQKNRALFDDLARVIEALAGIGIEAIAFKGPVLAFRAYGDFGLGMFGNPHILIRDADIARSMATLGALGYERKKQLTEAQLDLIHRLEGHETLLKKGRGVGVQVHTRLTPIHMAFDIDYAGLWRRARRSALSGRTMTTLSADDDFLVLAIDNGKDLWQRVEGACGVAAFIGSHPNLDWSAILDRARAQGCLRTVLLATSLARIYFGAVVPVAVTAAERDDPRIERIVRRVLAHWLVQEPAASNCNTFSLDHLRLHDGAVRRVRYAARTLALPNPLHVARNPFPRLFTSIHGYILIKIAHDAALLPLLRTYRYLLLQAERLRDALASHELALVLLPVSGETRLRLKRHHDARADANRALAADPNNAAAWHSLGDALFGLKRHKAAVACYDKALALTPENRTIWKNRGAAMHASDRKTANSDINDEPTPDPQDANAWAFRAGFFLAAERFGEAAAASDCALAINSQHLAAARIGIRSRLAACDWRKREEDERRIAEGLRAGLPIITPFNHRAVSDSEAQNFIAARVWANTIPRPKALWRGDSYRHDRTRIAYLSAEFHDHPVAVQIAGVFEHHDRTRFDTTAISLGPDDASTMRRRIEAAFDRFIDARALRDAQIATMMREMEIDIAIDLNGQLGGARPGILAHRPAPVQTSYLANCGTMGVPFIDYIIADRIVIPEHQVRHYTEKVVYLPNSYLCNDSRRDVPRSMTTRADVELPEKGFVFCCFNNNYKIAPQVFEVWMRLLKDCPSSVLWLLADNPYAILNLRREAAARGIAPERLVFAPRVPRNDHLARHRLADLFLDTLPVNANATASDALWAGLPLLTCMGNTFAGRVGASLLQAIGLPELVASSLAEYEAAALALARDPEAVARVRTKLMSKRSTQPLFDTAQITRNLETAYTTMWERTRRGEPPESFALASAPTPDAQDPNLDAQSGVTKSQPLCDPLATPDFFPARIDVSRNMIVFAMMSRDTFRQSTFLDRWMVRAGSKTLLAEIPKLLTRQAALPLQFILHVGYCGSTLLAQYLETLAHCLVLKEPDVLGQLLSLKRGIPAPADGQWAEWFKVTMALLSRGYPEDRAVVIKAGDINSMGHLFLDHNERTKIVFLFTPLRKFLLQVLKLDDRRQWLREHMQLLRWSMARVPFLSEITAVDLRDGQGAAAMWLLNAFICRSLLERPDSHRILILNGERLISQPGESVLAAADHLGLLADRSNRYAVQELRPLSHHSKDRRLAYDANTRAAELADAEARCGSEVEAAMSWAEQVSSGWLSRSPFPVE